MFEFSLALCVFGDGRVGAKNRDSRLWKVTVWEGAARELVDSSDAESGSPRKAFGPKATSHCVPPCARPSTSHLQAFSWKVMDQASTIHSRTLSGPVLLDNVSWVIQEHALVSADVRTGTNARPSSHTAFLSSHRNTTEADQSHGDCVLTTASSARRFRLQDGSCCTDFFWYSLNSRAYPMPSGGAVQDLQ
jgi:hypothetical protein